MKNGLVVAAMLLGMSAVAQEDAKLKQFTSKYLRPSSVSSVDPWAHQMNKPMPQFNFSKQLNSEALKGKVVVLDFWATWCAGCLVVSHGMDSLIVKETDAYKNVQIIGVNTKEKMVDKGYDAHDYWKKTGKAFPMVDGPAADSCGVSVENGFPTLMVVDDKGIVRKRWDGAGPSTAGEVRMEIWKYAVYPKVKTMSPSWEKVKEYLEKKDWVTALYFADAMPEKHDLNSLLKLKAFLLVDERGAAAYAKELKDKVDTSLKSRKMAAQLMKMIAASPFMDQGMLETGMELYKKLSRRTPTANDPAILQDGSRIYKRYSQLFNKMAEDIAERSFQLKAESSGQTLTDEQLDKLKKEFGF